MEHIHFNHLLQTASSDIHRHSFNVPVAIQRRYSRVNSCRDTLMTAREIHHEVKDSLED